MKRFVMTLLVGAGIAALTMSAARAEQFTIERVTAPNAVPSTPGGFNVNFLNLNVEEPANPADYPDSNFPGTSLILLNYTVTGTPPVGTYNFNSTQPFQIVWRGKGPLAAGQTYVSNFNLSVTGFANRTALGYQDNVVVNLTPVGPADMNFLLGPVPFTVFDIQKTLPPVVNDTVNPGAISVRVVSPIPEPGSMALLGTALLPIIGLARRRK